MQKNFVAGATFTLTTTNLGTPSTLVLANAAGLPISTGVSGLGAGVAAAHTRTQQDTRSHQKLAR